MAEVTAEVAAINARVARLGTRHAKALAKVMKHAPRAGVKMSWMQQYRFERYRRSGLALLQECGVSAIELSAMIDRVLATQQLTEAERAQVKDALVPEWARRLTKQQTKKEEQT